MSQNITDPNNDGSQTEELVTHGEALLKQANFEELAHWLADLPTKLVDATPRLRYLRARRLVHADEWADAVLDLEHARQSAIEEEDWWLAIEANLWLARVHQRQEEIDLAHEYLKAADSLARRHPPSDRAKEGQMAIGIGRLYPDLGDNHQAAAWCSKALRIFEATGDVPNQVEALWLLAVSYCYLAQLSQARTYIKRALYLNTTHALGEVQRMYLLNVEAYIELYAGHTEDGLAILAEAAPLRKRYPASKPALYLTMAEAALHRQARDLESSLTAYARAESIIHDLDDEGFTPWLTMERGWTRVLAGDDPSEVRRALLAVVDPQNQATRRSVQAHLAVLDILEERYQDATARLQKALAGFEKTGELMLVFASHLYLAYAHLRRGSTLAAHAEMEAGLGWAEQARVDGFPLLWHPVLVAEVCAEALQAGIHPRQVEVMFIRRLGDAGVPVLMRLLDDSATEVRIRAESILSALGRDEVMALFREMPASLGEALLDHLREGRLAMSKLETLERKLRTAEQYDRANWLGVAVLGYYVTDQFTRQEIAERLGVSPATVRNHITEIRRAFGIASRGVEELRMRATREGFLLRNQGLL